MEAEVIIYADAAACTVIMVLHAQSHGPARNPLVTFIDGSIHRSGIRGVETRQIPVEESIPMFVEIITELQVTTILLKTHTGAMVVTTSVLGSNRTGEITRTHLIGDFSLNRSPGACTQIDIRTHAVLLHAARHDVDDSTHRITAVKHGSRATKHLHALSHHCLIAVADGVAIDALILRMTVDEHQQLSCTSADTTEIDASGSPATDTVAHHAASRSEKARHLLCKRRQHIGAEILSEFFPVDYIYRHGKMTHTGSRTGTCHNHILKRDGSRVVLSLSHAKGCRQKRHRKDFTILHHID